MKSIISKMFGVLAEKFVTVMGQEKLGYIIVNTI